MKNKYDSDYKQDKTRTGSKKGKLVLLIRRFEKFVFKVIFEVI